MHNAQYTDYLDQPDSGSVWLNGHNLTELSAREAAKVRSREIGFIFQNHHLLPHCTALENVLIPLMASGQAVTADGEHRARQLLNRVGLGERLNHLPGRLSGGERQRCAVVRSLINTPKVILADEPTGALDRANATEVGRLLTEFLPIGFLHGSTATGHPLANGRLINLKAVGQFV